MKIDSLDKNSSKDDFKYLSQEFDSNILDLVKQKGFYPYKYPSDFEKFKKQLPSKENFYSSFSGKNIIGKEYEYAFKVWNKFEMKMMKDYYDLYLKFDILLLADVFEKFRNNSFKNYGLRPGHYLSAPGLSWDAMLKMIKIELELITDPDIFILYEKGTRGRISYISNI